MGQDPAWVVAISIVLVLANAFFVAAEYALVGARRSRIQALARKRRRNPAWLLRVLDDISPYVAGTQIGITMVGIAVGSITEPFVTRVLMGWFGERVPHTVSFLVAYFLIIYVLVVVGELFPKYLSIRRPERIAVVTTRPLSFITRILSPIVWLAQSSAGLLLRPFGIDPNAQRSEALPKDELLLLIRTGIAEGVIEKMQADLLARTLRLNTLDSKDVMVHRLDMQCLEVNTPNDQLLERLGRIPHSRIPVYEKELDNLLGVVYLHEIVKAWPKGTFNLQALIHPAIVVPENLTVDKLIALMRDEKTQIVIVADEYGGTSGLITLEDIVEEVFGELEDQLEVQRPPIETLSTGRVTARGDVRFDELMAFLGIELPEEPATDTLATMVVNALDRVPKLGDKVDTEIGTLFVENMARRRITRVSLIPRKLEQG